jgi:hypothetical protein
MLLAGEMTERTDGGQYIVVAGRRWRTADPMIHAYLPGTAPQALAALDSSPGPAVMSRSWRSRPQATSVFRPGGRGLRTDRGVIVVWV